MVVKVMSDKEVSNRHWRTGLVKLLLGAALIGQLTGCAQLQEKWAKDASADDSSDSDKYPAWGVAD